jgi:hypothetical protein
MDQAAQKPHQGSNRISLVPSPIGPPTPATRSWLGHDGTCQWIARPVKGHSTCSLEEGIREMQSRVFWHHTQ